MAEAKGSYVGGTPVYFKDEKARAMLSNEYVPAENYAAGNLCIHEGKLYKATKATTGTWDATAWTETNLAEVNAGMQKSITDLTENMVPNYNSMSVLYSGSSDVAERVTTIDKDGWVQCIAKTDSTSGTPFIRLFINDVIVYEKYGIIKNYSYAWSPLFRVKTGDIIKCTLTTETPDGKKELRFYLPM